MELIFATIKREEFDFATLEKTLDGEMVSCQVPGCNYQGKQITASHVTLIHGMSMKDYRAKYPQTPVSSGIFRQTMKSARRKFWDEHPEAKAAHGEKMRKAWAKPGTKMTVQRMLECRPPMSEESKRKRSRSMKALYQERLSQVTNKQ